VLEKDHIVTCWQQAISSTLGSTQDVRRHKIFALVESNAVPYVAACLQSGVNVNWTNEYGQTALYIAVWRGYNDLVELLLQCGSDFTIVAHRGSSVFSVPATCPSMSHLPSTCDNDLVELLLQRGSDFTIVPNGGSSVFSVPATSPLIGHLPCTCDKTDNRPLL
jgi:hypothetical protein